MGFEKLAALKEQLAEQAKSAPGKKPAPKKRPTPEAVTPQVDPVVQTIGRLQKRFPSTFPKNPAPKVPLKVGILDDLLKAAPELQLSEKEVRDAIKVWCRGTRYWNCLVEGVPRVDLTGAAVGEVSPADAGRARQLLTTRSARPTSTSKGKPASGA